MNKRLLDILLLIGAIVLAIAVYLYFQGNRTKQDERPGAAGPVAEQSLEEKRQAEVPREAGKMRQEDATADEEAGRDGENHLPGERISPPPPPPTKMKNTNKESSAIQERRGEEGDTKGGEKKIVTVPKEYPIEDAAKYYLPPEQRSPGNLGGPPPLNLPGMPLSPPEKN